MQRGVAVPFLFAIGIPVFGCAGVLGLDTGEPFDFDAGFLPGLDGMVPLIDAATPPDRAPPADADSEAGCTPDQKMCGGGCVAIDDPNFGCVATTCDPCPSENVASRTCVSGACALTCKTGYADCDPAKPGCETALGTDQNCKGCGDACPAGAPFCDANTKTCTDQCNPPKTSCGLLQCYNLANDPDHCGTACPGVACPSPVHADRACGGGLCNYTCQNPYSSCGADPALGCPYNTAGDLMHCGSNCTNCTGGVPVGMHPTGCNGSCQYACNPNMSDCDGALGCECNGTCSGTACVPIDSGTDSGVPKDAGTDSPVPIDSGTDSGVPTDSGTDSGVPKDSGPDGAACVPNGPVCSSEGTGCISNAECCGCLCTMNVCCYKAGDPAPGGMSSFCCTGRCVLSAGAAEAGLGDAAVSCICM